PVLATRLLTFADLHHAAQLEFRRSARWSRRCREPGVRNVHVGAGRRNELRRVWHEVFGVAHRPASSRTRGLRNAMMMSATSVEIMYTMPTSSTAPCSTGMS